MRIQDPGLVGIWLVVAGVVLILIEGIVAGIWTVRLSKRAQVLNDRLRSQQADLQSAVERLELSLAETVSLWQPYRRMLRWLRHPLTVALVQSYARRKAVAR